MTEILSHQHYTIQSELGRGGMGAVYLAFDTRLQRQVAIKCIRAPESSLQQQWLWSDAFQEEARLLAQINHPNIVQIYDLIEWDDQPALVMEYVEGQTLLEVLRSDLLHSEALSLATRLSWLTQILDGLAAAHEKGIIHRDLKPENIMITADGRVKIMDFGIARHQDQSLADNIHDSQALPGEFVGSPGALSPEQALGEPLTTASDIFSFGILAYSLLCGHHPFGDTSDPDGLLQNILYRAPIGFVPLDCLAMSQSTRADAAILTLECLSKSSSSRPSAQDCANKFYTFNNPEATAESLEKSKVPYVQGWQLALLLFVIVITFASFKHLNPEPLRHIAILSPAIDNIENADEATLAVARTAFSDTIFQRLQIARDAALIDSSELPENSPIEYIFSTTGATHVVAPKISCSTSRCKLSLSRYESNGKSHLLTGKKQWQVLSDSIEDIYLTTWQHTSSLFTEGAEKAEVIAESDYRSYLKLLEKFLVNASLSDHDYNELMELSERKPIFSPAIRLRANVAIALFKDSNNATELKSVINLLEKQRSIIGDRDYYEKSAEIFIALNDFENATRLLEKIRSDGHSYKYHELLADLLIRKNEFSKAIEQLEKLKNLRASNKVLYSMAYCYYAIGDFVAAEGSLISILNTSPDDARASAFLAGLFITQGKYEQAIQLINASPDRAKLPSNLNNLAIAYLLVGDYRNAEEAQKKALFISPDSPTKLNQMGEIYLALGDTANAEFYFTQTLLRLRSSNDIIDLIVGATADIHLGNLQEAEKKLKQAKSIQPNNSAIIYTEAIHNIKNGNHETAIRLIMQSAEAGYSPEWFSLPWFRDLCQSQDYNQIFSKAGKPSPCLTTKSAMDE